MQTETENNQSTTSQEPVTKNNEKIKLWKALLALVLTLGISLGAGYIISDKYLWKDIDTEQLQKKLDYSLQEVDAKPNDPEKRVQLGFTYFLMENYDKALEEFKTAISLDKNYYPSYLNMAIVYDKQDQSQKSLEMANKATKLAPKDYKGHLLKGISYRKLKMFDKSTASLEEALALMPSNADIIYEIGQVAEAQGNKKEAEQIYKDALAFDPLYKPAIKALERVSSKESK
ncbi:tetratricopeptide repeat protein [Neobacillus sp. SCS-31]|uniref:tetratricopeptide repeat protein n=1 Tax=Neobacillus oceani TaxID=3115292 RepID=UPI00390635B7